MEFDGVNLQEEESNDNQLQSLSRFQFFAEQFAQFLKPSIQPKSLVEIVQLFEIPKVYIRTKSFFSNKEKILCEEKNMYQEKIAQLKKSQDKDVLNRIWDQASYYNKKQPTNDSSDNNDTENDLQKAKDLLGISDEDLDGKKDQNIKPIMDENGEVIEEHEQIDQESQNKKKSNKTKLLNNINLNKRRMIELTRSKKQMGALTSLPYRKFKKGIRRSGETKVMVSEMLHILRPVFYLQFVKLKGTESYKPFFFSQCVDILCLFLLKDFEVESETELAEYNKRKKNLLVNYLQRRPFYQFIIRPRLLEPLLKKVIPFEFVRGIIVQAIDYRCCYSTLI